MQSKQKKFNTGILAALIAIAMALTGTLGWQSISLNETVTENNPGVRLHDDFNGENKDIYVENFGNVDIFARIRLDEYMEIGVGAGLKDGDDGFDTKDVVVLGTGNAVTGKSPEIDDVTTWTTHIPALSPSDCADPTLNPFHEYWQWTMGGKTVYIPTFNMNQDSLEADINGTYANASGVDKDGDGVAEPYEDYKEYGLGDVETGIEIVDAEEDFNSIDELAGKVNIKDVITNNDPAAVTDVETNYTANVTLNKGTDGNGVKHDAAETLDADVVTMAEWIAGGATLGNFWVYDTDGWAYWANPIKPGTATGLLLDGISPKAETDGEAYYAINAVAQFATAGDWGEIAADGGTGTGFYDTEKGSAPTEDALYLLNKAADLLPKVTDISLFKEDDTAVGSNISIYGDSSITLKAKVTVENSAGEDSELGVSWAVTDETGAQIDAKFYTVNGNEITFSPSNDMIEKTYTITATSTYDSTKSISTSVLVVEDPLKDIKKIEPGSTETATIDDIEWYVLAKQDGKALLWTKYVIKDNGSEYNTKFGTSNLWASSIPKTYLNDTFLNSLTTLKEHAVDTTIYTANTYNRRDNTYVETTQKVFLLSEADVFGTANYKKATEVKEYTLGEVGIIVKDHMKKSSTVWGNWLRSPKYSDYALAALGHNGFSGFSGYSVADDFYLRPALWVNISS